MSLSKELPHDVLSEKSLLSCLLIDGSVFDEISDLMLVGDDFHHPQYGIVFESIKDLCVQSQPVDYVTVCSKLSDV